MKDFVGEVMDRLEDQVTEEYIMEWLMGHHDSLHTVGAPSAEADQADGGGLGGGAKMNTVLCLLSKRFILIIS
jgi:hypothetical protein